MHQIPVSDLQHLDYNVSVVNALKQYWKLSQTFSCLNHPKTVNMLLYLDGCKACYTMKNGETITVNSGSITYTPTGCEYRVHFYDFENEHSNTIGINFYLFDSDNVPFIFSEKPLIFPVHDKSYQLLFQQIDAASEHVFTDYGKMKAGMYTILSSLSEYCTRKYFNKYSIISKGILFLEENSDQTASIAEIAAMCNVSEIYFRKLFKEYSGMSPVEYRIQHKLMLAKLYLEYENMTVAEIAEKLSFSTTSHFIKMFKKHTGMTPLQYRNSNPHTVH